MKRNHFATWKQLSGDFAKLASEEKSASAIPLGAMAAPEANPLNDVSDWVFHNGHSENLRAQFELLASQGGRALGPMPLGATPLRFWLHRLYQHLRENKSSLCRFFIGSDVEAPLIDTVCEASSTFCLRLEKRAIEQDQESDDIAALFRDWIIGNHVSVSIPAQISYRNHISLVAENATIPIPIEFLSSRLQAIGSTRGRGVFGSPGQFFNEMAETHGLIWAITQRGLWMAQQPPCVGAYIDANGVLHRKILVDSANATPNGKEFDVFISHSSADKAYVAPLVSALETAKISVWFDETVMEWGDSLRSEIDRGLAACRYGIVVFSKAFLKKKKWTEHELDSLFAREGTGIKVILPIWHGITRDDLVDYSPAFADRLAKSSTTDSYADIVRSLLLMLGRPKPASSPNPSAPVANAAGPAEQPTLSSSNGKGLDDHFAKMAVEEARRSQAEDGREHPRVGCVVVRDGKILAAAYRGELTGNHAEFVALEAKLKDETLGVC